MDNYAGSVRVAMRTGSSTLNYLLGDHLGSTTITTDVYGVETGEMNYYPWGTERWSSGSIPTTYQFTGQRLESALGLYFYGARYYDPMLGRFVQADTVVPSGVQGLDRYAYTINNPLKYTDPSGHQICDSDGYCGSDPAHEANSSLWYLHTISDEYGWIVKGKWSVKNLKTLYQTGSDIDSFIDGIGGNGKEWIQKYLGNAEFNMGSRATTINNIVNAIGTVPWKSGIYFSTGFSERNAAHELGHVFENNIAGGLLPATVIGGGPADAMVSFEQGNPGGCILRWECIGISNEEYVLKIAGSDPWPVDAYANHSIADDFAYTFEHTIYGSDYGVNVASSRLMWMEVFIELTDIGFP